MTTKTRAGWGTLPKALWAALQWRVMLIWLVLLALPTAIVISPVGHALGSMLDHSVHSSAMAQHFHGLLMGDTFFYLMQHNGSVIGGAQFLALLVTIGLSPFLTGVVVTAVAAQRHPSFGELMHGGLAQYWRMLRLMIWSLVPYIIALVIGGIAMKIANAHAEQVFLQSSADTGHDIAWAILIVLLVLAHVIMESSRAQVAADGHLRSATRAFGRGIMMLLTRPLATLGLYLSTSIIGYVLAGLVGVWRIHTTATGWGVVGAIVLTQVIVIILAWQRMARISALATVAQARSGNRGMAMGSLAPA